MPDFWPSCGYRLLTRRDDGQLAVSDDFLRSLLLRPELEPVPESCAAERALHDSLLAQPRIEVAEPALAALRDADAADNYRVWLRFRQRLLAAPTLEASYLALFAGEGVDVPPLFVHQLTQILLRHVLGDDAPPLHARAAEMLFRPQRIAVQSDGAVMAADDETVERHALTGGFGSLGQLLQQSGATLRTAELDVLHADNAERYWERDERHDLVISLNHGQPAPDALCRVLERWIAHFLGVQVSIATAREIDDEHWVWHVGLDAQASGVLNDLYTGADVDEDRMQRVLCLFTLQFLNPADMHADIAGHPVYLAMAMDAQSLLRLKPQNLLLNLPLARRS